ncbi:MAG: hypothetical protein LBB27_02130 [Tannerellaceae bacterium]|jgi:predicted transcriptional regulator|nr:hypothetical protein [Tannerellaceae bacterium]
MKQKIVKREAAECDAYFASVRIGAAIHVRKSIRYPEPLDLSLFGLAHAPQSFVYVYPHTI